MIKKLLKVGGLITALLLTATVWVARPAEASTCTQTPLSHSGSMANLKLNFQNAAGRSLRVTYTLNETCGASSIVHNPNGESTSTAPNQNSITRTVAGNDLYAYSFNGGNGYTLDCRQITNAGGQGTNNGYLSVFNVSIATKFGVGYWRPSGTFTVENGSTLTLTYTWINTAPTVTNGSVQGYKIDVAGNTLGAGFAANVSLSGVGSLTTNPFFFSGNVPAGSHTLTAQTPYNGKIAYKITTQATGAGLVTYNATSATFNVPAGKVVDVRIFYKPVALGYQGYLDTASCSSITGWAENLAMPASTISVTLKSGGTTLATIPAGTYRADVGNHSFSFTPPMSLFDGATHSIRGVLIKTAGGTQVLTNSPRTLGPCFTPIVHKIFNINFLSGLPQVVRDNETFPFNLLSYMFPDTGAKGAGGLFHLWLSGVYDNNSGVVNSDSSNNASLDAIKTINNLAELGCDATGPLSCKNRLPLAYVPQEDGSGKDGSSTPNGNVWMTLRQNNYGGADAHMGGIASTDKSNVGGFAGVHLNRDEISKVRVSATGIQTDATGGNSFGQAVQGLLNPSTQLQADARSLNLPTGSQGPQGPRVWDNLRNPNLTNSNYSANQTASSLDFISPSPGIFSGGAVAAINSASGSQYRLQYLNGTATSLLQDGQGGSSGYHSNTEPLTITAGVASVGDVNLKWDEYVDWTQVDNKGHYYPVSSGVNTGYQLGDVVPAHYVATQYFSGGWLGGPTYATGYNCYTSNWVYDGQSYGSGCPTGDYAFAFTYPTNYLITQTIGCASASNDSTTISWATPNHRWKFGWYNSATSNTGSIPTGGNGGTLGSAFAPNPASNPNWALTKNNAYWQDPTVTVMDTSGATPPLPTQSPQWIYNSSDPLYTDRMIYDGSDSHYYSYGVSCKSTSSFQYYTGTGKAADIKDSYTYISDYYPNAQPLYENSLAPTTQPYGLYGAGATFDGSTDGNVMTGWAWSDNLQRVRYENTWKAHSRDLHSRSITGSVARDDLLYGPDFDNSASQPTRDASTIYNPTISGASGDIFSGGSISGYFSGNNLAGAYLFANGGISNFTGQGLYPNYFNNPSTRSGTTYVPGAPDPLHKIFPNFDSTIGAATTPFSTASYTISLDKKVYMVPNDLVLDAHQFCSGAGTIYVKGTLTITGNLSYCGGAITKDQVPSVGFVVTGNIIVDPGVTSIVGTYVANRSFTTQSNLAPDNRSATTGDLPFTLNGSMIASSYSLQRQLSGLDLMKANLGLGNKTETFNYDGRVVVSPPPGFNSLNGSVQSVLNEAVPRN